MRSLREIRAKLYRRTPHSFHFERALETRGVMWIPCRLPLASSASFPCRLGGTNPPRYVFYTTTARQRIRPGRPSHTWEYLWNRLVPKSETQFLALLKARAWLVGTHFRRSDRALGPQQTSVYATRFFPPLFMDVSRIPKHIRIRVNTSDFEVLFKKWHFFPINHTSETDLKKIDVHRHFFKLLS